MAGASIVHILLFLVAAATAASAHNITAILNTYPDYSLYNHYLTETRVSDEINTRNTLTVLLLNNANMSSLAATHTPATIKNALRLLTLLDYFDLPKLHSLASSTLSATLLQTTGTVSGNAGFLAITKLNSGIIQFSPTVSSFTIADYTKSVNQIPYNISVLEISAPITFPGLIDAAATGASANLTSILDKAGCKIFAAFLTSSKLLGRYQAAMAQGPFTVLAPKDGAFSADGVPNLSSLSTKDLTTVLFYHALPSYTPKASLKAAVGSIRTMASIRNKFQLSVTSNGDDVSLITGVGSSRVLDTVLDSAPVCVMTVDSLLLPV